MAGVFLKKTLVLFVGGVIKWEPKLCYMGGTSHVYKNVDIDELCCFDLSHFHEEATGEKASSLDVYYLEPGHEIGHGLKQVKTDEDILEMQRVHKQHAVLTLWMEETYKPIMDMDDTSYLIDTTPPIIDPLSAPQIEKHVDNEGQRNTNWDDFIEEGELLQLESMTRDQESQQVPEDRTNVENNKNRDASTDDVVSDSDEWLADDFEGQGDDNIFAPRADNHEVEEYRKYKLHGKKEAERKKRMREERKQKRASRMAGANKDSDNANPSSGANMDSDNDNHDRYEGACEGFYSEDESGSDEELDKGLVSDEEEEEKHHDEFEEWKEKNYPDMDKFEMKVGMIFPNKGVFREVLRDWAVRNGFDLDLEKCEQNKISAYCKENCDWYIYASKYRKTVSFQVKTLRGSHKCCAPKKNSQATYKYIGKRLQNDFRDNPRMDIGQIEAKIWEVLNIEPSNHTMYRAKRYALELVKGDIRKEYGRLWDYCATLCKYNPGSQCEMKLNKELTPPALERMYFGLTALKVGFKAGCRPIIGLDGCFLKGVFKGQLLAAMGRDANDNLYPIAMAYVGTESRDTWTWFLKILLREIGSYEENGWAFISDRQKGLLDAVDELANGAEHRFCLRHMYNNFKAKFRGLDMKRLFWKAASVCTKVEYNRVMQEIKNLYPQSEEGEMTPYVWLSQINPEHWARSHFPTRTKCCSLVNNMSESFNNYILAARDLPIISMWEWIRTKLMSRIQVKYEGMRAYEGIVCPNILRKMRKEKQTFGKGARATWAGNENYQVKWNNEEYVVKLDEKTCSCGIYQLRGYPCIHAIAAIGVHRGDWEPHIDQFYSKDKYLATYENMIHPVPGPGFYEDTGKGPIQPPIIQTKLGRPQKERRKDGNDFKDPTKVTRKNEVKSCSKCFGTGHNKRSCPNPAHKNSKYKDVPTQSSATPARAPPKKPPSWMKHVKTKAPRNNVYVLQKPINSEKPQVAPSRIAAIGINKGRNIPANATRTTPAPTPPAVSTTTTTFKRAPCSAPSAGNPPVKKPRQHKPTEADVLKNIRGRKRGPPQA